MEIEIFVGLPFIKWYKWGTQPGQPVNPFNNFRLKKEIFI